MTTCRVVCIATASRFLIGVLGGLSDSLAADYDTSSGLQALACSTERGASASTPNGKPAGTDILDTLPTVSA